MSTMAQLPQSRRCLEDYLRFTGEHRGEELDFSEVLIRTLRLVLLSILAAYVGTLISLLVNSPTVGTAVVAGIVAPAAGLLYELTVFDTPWRRWFLAHRFLRPGGLRSAPSWTYGHPDFPMVTRKVKSSLTPEQLETFTVLAFDSDQPVGPLVEAARFV